jgi:hypothetical protein
LNKLPTAGSVQIDDLNWNNSGDIDVYDCSNAAIDALPHRHNHNPDSLYLAFDDDETDIGSLFTVFSGFPRQRAT